MFDWDDLRVFRAVAEAGTTLGAARRLGISQPTVVRRIAGFERAVGVALFERSRTGYRLTEAGEELVPLAEQVGKEVEAINDMLASRSRSLAGTIRVTAAEPVANMLLAPAVLDFQRTNPNVAIQLLIADRFLDLARGEADVALRATFNGLEDSNLVGRKLVDAPWAVYCSREYMENRGRPCTPLEADGHPILSSERSAGDAPVMHWLEEAVPNAKLVWRSNSLSSLQSAVRAGLGLAPLPCLLGRNDPELVKCFDAGGAAFPDIWLLAHAAARSRPHIQSFIAALSDHVIAHADLLRDES
ncbi:LysR family transcriptional regulator [Brevundimonas basaltis]|uniref:DNA-binding transcriptional LysR family regulator n=1 Tax=Brevundimonas basaltis TaxID=472166 RepID=A0A7W8HWQ4_9CAUL|nr:LysR family transcriptional regulator [Brevundimonas basaltis]MBB5291321.1 DNA-binding transcriptional LysR family regulator [Brevundimonas basaltis]